MEKISNQQICLIIDAILSKNNNLIDCVAVKFVLLKFVNINPNFKDIDLYEIATCIAQGVRNNGLTLFKK